MSMPDGVAGSGQQTVTRPRLANERTFLAACARRLRDQRAEGYPALVADGRMTEAEAGAGVRVATAIAAGWTAIALYEPEPDNAHDPDRGGAWDWERRDALANATIRARAGAEANPADAAATDFADALDALLWWETARPSARQLADATIQGRARGAQDRAAQPSPRSSPQPAHRRPDLFGAAA